MRKAIVGLLTFGLLIGGVAGAVPIYSVIDLGDLPGGDDRSNAGGLNEIGQVVGSSVGTEGERAFIWDSAGGMRDLGSLSPSDRSTFGSAINDHGEVVGTVRTESGLRRGFLWDARNGMRDLIVLTGEPGFNHAADINDAGQIVGYSDEVSATAFMWAAAEGVRDLGSLPGGRDTTRAFGINAIGQVVGGSFTAVGPVSEAEHAFLWDDGTMIDLGDLPGGFDYSVARDVNDLGQVVGVSDAVTVPGIGERAFLWDGGEMQDLGILPNHEWSGARAINDIGQVVGYSRSNADSSAFLWDVADGMQDLNLLIDPLSDWIIVSASDINDRGQIAAYGYNPSIGYHALLLDPIVDVPEPDTFALLGVGLAGFGLIRRRKI